MFSVLMRGLGIELSVISFAFCVMMGRIQNRKLTNLDCNNGI